MKTFIRRLSQWFFLAGLTFLFIRQDYTQAPQPIFTWIGWLDPLTGLSGLIHGQWPWLIVISVAALAVAFWRKRFFCGWICPVGTFLDLIGALKRLLLKDWRPGTRALKILDRFRWAIFGGILGLVILGHAIVLSFDPLVLWPRDITRLIVRTIPWSLLGVTFLGLVTFPRFWCRFVCPTGSTLHLAGRLGGSILTAGDSCRHCGLCVKQCPNMNITPELEFGADCLDCGLCQKICPKKSVAGPKPFSTPINEGRRDLLIAAGVGAGLLAVGAATKMIPAKTTASAPRWKRLLRPPGALREETFALTCDRCEQCINVCPTKALIPTGLEAGVAAIATPRFVPRRGRCMQCMACGQVCPTGALIPVQPQEIRLGTAKINHDTCIVWATKKRCLLCVEVCPTFAISIDKRGRPTVDKAKCIGCGACESGCPVKGAAIRVYNEGEKRR